MPAPSKNWTVINDGAVDSDSPIDQALMTAIRDDLVHLEEWLGLSYTAAQDHDHDGVNSKSVVGVADGTISTAKLKTTTGEITAANGTAANTALPGGEWGFYPRMKTNDSVNTRPFGSILNESGGIPTSYTTWMYIGNTNGTAGTTAYAQQRYVQSSPPYEPYRAGDMVPLFVFALLDKASGRVLSTYTAPEPPWANNGPTIINPLGRLMALARALVSMPEAAARDETAARARREQDLADMYAFFKDHRNLPSIEQELARKFTQEEKNGDMMLIPHPFLGHDLTNYQAVVIGPTDDNFCRALAARHEFLGDSIGEILHGNYLTIDNTPMSGLVTPAGCMAVRARWKLTQ